jgi:hypothetical protein
MKKQIEKKLLSILETTRKIEYNGIVLHLIGRSELDQVLQLELSVRANDIENGVEKKNHFYDHAKIINPNYPAFKYTLSMKHKKKEIFDPAKVEKALPAEFQIWKNKSRVALEKEIKHPDSAITDDQAKELRKTLEEEISISEEKINKVLENYHKYNVIISTFEQYNYYPALYFVMELEGGKSKASDTHLRKDVPNVLWFHDERPFSELRANDKMSRIIQTFDRYCETIYIEKK